MICAPTEKPTVAGGNLRLLDLTRDGVTLRVSDGVDREEALNHWFSRHVPRGPWRALSPGERRALADPGPHSSAAPLVVMDFPQDLRDAFWEDYATPLFQAESDASRKSTMDAYRAFLLETLEGLPGFAVRGVRTFDFLIGPPGSRSTAYDAKSGRHVGLHLDDHENLGFEGRSRGFQLLSINLGHAERHFQFVNHDTASLLRLIGGVSALPEDARSAASLVQTVLGAFPDCPVVRITLRPGQGYIGVTQDFIHDGSTNERGRLDVSVLLGGRFELTRGGA